MDVCRHPLNLDGEDPHAFGQSGVPGDRTRKEFELVGNAGLPLQAELGEVFPVLRIGDCIDPVPLRLPGLGEQDQGRRIGLLQAEREVQKDEGIEVERPYHDHVRRDQ